MIKKNKLIEVRNSKNYSQDYLAATLDMCVSSYSRKEQGKIRITDHEWQKLSEVLEVPLEDIYESDESMIFVFNDNSTGNGNIVTNYTMPQSILESQKKYIEKLEEENQNLKEEVRVLKEEILKHKTH